VLDPGLYWDLAVPYHYVRPLPDGRVLIGGADAKQGEADPRDRLALLEEWAIGRLPVISVDERWAAELFDSADGLPYVGRLPGRLGAWVATGFAGTGLTWGTFAAERITAGILGDEERDEDGWFSPRRFALVSGFERMAEDNADVAWKMLVDRLRPTGDLHPADLAPDEGRVLTVDGRKVAVWRDSAGALHALSPVCRHLGCIVRWNPLDHTWDCPCHGGRYAADGRRLYGPPTRDLERRTIE
jgi:nitrite reductase/ring-hydroxylating ferredoxin subunit